ncbi:MAG: HD domain-containing protein, partial [Nitrospinales bacterium]
TFRAKLKEKIDPFISPELFAGTGEIDLQKFYLEFKKRISGFVVKETDGLKKELRYTFNSHLLLLKYTALVDTVLQTSFKTVLQLYNRIHQKQIREQDVPIAIIARGGYGREEMYFCSDVDIQIVSKPIKAQENPEQVQEILKYFEYLFIHQDIFPTASSATFTETSIEEEEFDTKNITTLISLLEHRFVAGNASVYNEFKSSIRTTSLLHMEDIIKECMTHRTYYEVQNTVFQQEPNIKEELRRPYWALSLARLRHKMVNTNVFRLLFELYDSGKLSAPAFKNIHNALNFLSRIRLFLHCNQSGGHTDVLSFEIREKVAKFMGYELHKFYREYFYNVALPLKRYSRNLFWESVTFENGKVTHLSEHFSLNANRQIIFRENVPPPTLEASEWIFEIISWVAKEDYYLSYPVIRAIEQNLDQMSPIFLDLKSKEEIQASFNQIINGKYFAKAIRQLHEFGLLANHLIPEFKNLCGLLQDIYVHQFPTDIHVLFALDALNKLEIDPNADPFLVELYQSVNDKTTLKLAVVLHDIGKGAKQRADQNEEMLGAQMAPGILKNLGFGHNHRLVADIQFLIEEHLKMRDLMHLDPDEDETYELIWDLVNHDKERLKMLILLTYADRGGTKMK